MRRVWFGAIGLAAAACEPGGATWSAEPPPATPPPPTDVVQLRPPPPPHDAPASCIDARDPHAVWEYTARERIAARLSDLGSCTSKLTRARLVEVALSFRKDGSVERVKLPRTTLDDCRVLECIRHGLTAVSVPPPPADRAQNATVHAKVALLPPAAASDSQADRAGPPRLAEHDPDFEGLITNCLRADDRRPDETASGRLPPEQIQELVQRRYDKFLHCYEVGLARDPHLHGRVEIRFDIDPKGAVTHARISNNELPDCDVARCVRDAMRLVQFPPPEGGSVTVVYPIMLEPPHETAAVSSAPEPRPPLTGDRPLSGGANEAPSGSETSGRLPPERIQAIVRAGYGNFRLCYEAGLARNADLSGRVNIRFVIGRDGGVSNVSVDSTTLPDRDVAACVAKGFYDLKFPEPEGGIVTVIYPIMLEPG